MQEPEQAEVKITDQTGAAPDPPPAAASLSETQHELVARAPAKSHESLPSALEPELRKIIDTAVARVAEIELDAIRQSRALTQRSEEQGREALKYALDRAFQLMNSFELLTGTINGMLDALRAELDDAVQALRSVQEPESDLSRELDARRAAEAPAAVAEPAPPPVVAEPTERPPVVEEPVVEAPVAEEPEPAPVAAEPEPAPVAEEQAPEPAPEPVAEPSRNGGSAETLSEPSPEMTEMFREQIQNMKSSGKSREEAERSLLRFNLGRRFLGLLDEVYSEDSDEAAESAGGEKSKGRVRGFFSR